LNPVVRVLNMVLGPDGSLQKRKDFGTAPTGSPSNHIVAELNGVPTILIKDGTSVKYSTNGTTYSTITMDTDDPPINAGVPHPDARGSFAIHGQEVYYCDINTIFSWDGVN